jgi:hypothetical protein
MTSLLDVFTVDWRGLSVLAVARSPDPVVERLRSDRGATAVETLDDLNAIPDDYAERSFDMVLVDDAVYTLSPTEAHDALRWLHDHLKPGGGCLFASRTYLGPDGGGFGERLHTPYAHLAFAGDVVDAYYAERGWPPARRANVMCRATYLVLLRRVGFAIEEVQVEEEVPQLFGDKLQWYDPDELRASVLRARLRRPTEEERERELSELRAALKAR